MRGKGWWNTDIFTHIKTMRAHCTELLTERGVSSEKLPRIVLFIYSKRNICKTKPNKKTKHHRWSFILLMLSWPPDEPEVEARGKKRWDAGSPHGSPTPRHRGPDQCEWSFSPDLSLRQEVFSKLCFSPSKDPRVPSHSFHFCHLVNQHLGGLST